MYNFEALDTTDRKEMLNSIGVNCIDEIFNTIPQSAKMQELNLEEGKDEIEAQLKLKEIASLNKTNYISFLGNGFKNRYIPSCIADISSRFEFLSCYTPYQAEISQGSLEIMYEFQTMMCELTNQDVSNASVYDGASACAEAILMASRITKNRKVFIDENINKSYLEVIKTYLWANGIEIVLDKDSSDNDLCAKLYQTPNKYGELVDILSKNNKELIISCVDLMSLVMFEPPKSDITVGDVQSFGIGLNFGGATAGFIACKDAYKRQLPGRIAGKSMDSNTKDAYCLTLQAREQHIRREKATSNICSNQALVAFMSNLYLRKLGKTMLNEVAKKSFENAHLLAIKLAEIGFEIENKEFFDEFTLQVGFSDGFLKQLKENNILAGMKLDKNRILVCATELTTKDEIDLYVKYASSLVLNKI